MTTRSESIAQLNTFVQSHNPETAATIYPNDTVRVEDDSIDATGAKEDDLAAPPPPGVSEADVKKAAAQARSSYQAKLAAAKEKQRQIDEAKRREEAERTAAERTTRETVRLATRAIDFGSSLWRKSREKLGGVPTPGDIWVPLAILLFFFFVLFPVNGHTRLMWLWMTVTNNAVIGGALPAPTLNPAPPIMNPGQAASQVESQLRSFAPPIMNPGQAASGTGSGPSGNGNGHTTNYAQLMQSTTGL